MYNDLIFKKYLIIIGTSDKLPDWLKLIPVETIIDQFSHQIQHPSDVKMFQVLVLKVVPLHSF